MKATTVVSLSVKELEEELHIRGRDRILEVYTFGEYQIVKASKYFNGAKEEDSYHGLINGRRTTKVWEDFDAAILGLVAEKHEGCNSQAGFYFARALGIYKKDK